MPSAPPRCGSRSSAWRCPRRNPHASIGSTGDAYDNAMAESLVDTYKTELIADRAWRSAAEVELATVEWSAGTTAPACTARSATSSRTSSSVTPLKAATAGAVDGRAGGPSHGSPYGLAVLDPAAPTTTLLTLEQSETASVEPGPAQRATWRSRSGSAPASPASGSQSSAKRSDKANSKQS